MSEEFKNLNYRAGHIDGMKEGFQLAVDIVNRASIAYTSSFKARPDQHQYERQEYALSAIRMIKDELFRFWDTTSK